MLFRSTLIDALINKVTMYRLVLYVCAALLIDATLLGATHFMSYTPLMILLSTAVIFAASWITNRMFAFAFDAPYNPESTWLTAFILALLITPASSFTDTAFYVLAGGASALAIASKYLLAIRKKHLFNPAAFGVAAEIGRAHV